MRPRLRQMSLKRTAWFRLIPKTGTYSVASYRQKAAVQLVTSCLGARKTQPVSHRDFSHHVASARRGRLPPRSSRSAQSISADRVLRPLRDRGGPQQVATQYHGSVWNSYIAPMSSAPLPGEPSGSSDGSKTSRPHTKMALTQFEEGLGRVMYVAGSPEHERPFLGPLYRFMFTVQRFLSCRRGQIKAERQWLAALQKVCTVPRLQDLCWVAVT